MRIFNKGFSSYLSTALSEGIFIKIIRQTFLEQLLRNNWLVFFMLGHLVLVSCQKTPKKELQDTFWEDDMCMENPEEEWWVSFVSQDFHDKQSPLIFTYFPKSSFINNEEMVRESIDCGFGDMHFAPGPFNLTDYQEMEESRCWNIKDLPSVFVWFSNEPKSQLGEFYITDKLGVPLKAEVVSLANYGEFISFLIVKERLEDEKKYFLYFKEKVGERFVSWIQPLSVQG